MQTADSRANNLLVQLAIWVLGVCLATVALPASAAEPTSPGTPEQRAELFIKLLKRRAQRILEARRGPPPPPLFSVSAGIAQGYETNVNLDGERRGDYFMNQDLTLLLRPQVNSWLSAEFAYNLFNSQYQDLTDSNILINNIASTLQFQPHPRFRLDLGHEYGVVNFPLASDSSFFDHRVKTELLLAHTAWLVHKFGWTYQRRVYDSLRPNDPDGNERAGVLREDQRHIFYHEMRFSFPKTFVRVGTEFYRNFSNELFEDFYDWGNFQVRAVVNRPLTSKMTGVFAASYERRNYQSRNVEAINMAERDDLITLAGSLIQQLRDNLQLVYSLTYRHQDSNDPVEDFTDLINQVGLSFSF